MRGVMVSIVILVIVCLLGFGLLSGSPFYPGNKAEFAKATAQAQLLSARSTPLSDAAIVGMHGMDEMTKQQNRAIDGMVKIAVSGDAAQASIAWSGTLTGLIAPLTLLGAGVLILAIRLNKKKEE
jgi:hypothetical protein